MGSGVCTGTKVRRGHSAVALPSQGPGLHGHWVRGQRPASRGAFCEAARRSVQDQRHPQGFAAGGQWGHGGRPQGSSGVDRDLAPGTVLGRPRSPSRETQKAAEPASWGGGGGSYRGASGRRPGWLTPLAAVSPPIGDCHGVRAPQAPRSSISGVQGEAARGPGRAPVRGLQPSTSAPRSQVTPAHVRLLPAQWLQGRAQPYHRSARVILSHVTEPRDHGATELQRQNAGKRLVLTTSTQAVPGPLCPSTQCGYCPFCLLQMLPFVTRETETGRAECPLRDPLAFRGVSAVRAALTGGSPLPRCRHLFPLGQGSQGL